MSLSKPYVAADEPRILLVGTSQVGAFDEYYITSSGNLKHLRHRDSNGINCCYVPGGSRHFGDESRVFGLSGGRIFNDLHFEKFKEEISNSSCSHVVFFLGGNDLELFKPSLINYEKLCSTPDLIYSYHKGGLHQELKKMSNRLYHVYNDKNSYKSQQSMALQFMKKLKELVAGLTINILICSVPPRLKDTLEMCISKHVFNSKLKKMVQDSTRFEYVELSSIFDVETADFSRLVCRRRTERGILKDTVHYNRETMVKVADIIMASVDEV